MYIDVSMLDCQIAILENAIARYLSKNEIPKPMGSRHPSIAPFEAFKTKDSYIIIAAGNDKLFEKLCKLLEISKIINDVRFKDNSSRAKNMDELKKILEKKYQNVSVIVPESNTGNGGGANVGLRHAKSKYVLYLDVDVELNKTTLEILYSYAKKLNDFSILGPAIEGLNYKKKDYAQQSIYEKVHSMNFITGCALFFNMKAMSEIGF